MSFANDQKGMHKRVIANNQCLNAELVDSGYTNVISRDELHFTESGNKSARRVFVGEEAPSTNYDSVAKVGDEYIQITYSSGVPATFKKFLRTANGWEQVLTSADANWADDITVENVTTAGAATFTIAQLLGGGITRDPAGAARTDVLPTAALTVAGIKSALGSCAVGSAVRFFIRNTADAAEKITLSAGTGGTLSPTAIVIPRGQTKELLLVVSNITSSSEAYTLYDLNAIGNADQWQYVSDVTAAVDTAPTLTAAQILGGIVTGVPTAGRAYTLCTAADLLALLPNAVVGTTVEFSVINNSAGANTITVTATASITNGGLAGHLLVTQNTAASFKIRFTNVTASSEAAVIYRC